MKKRRYSGTDCHLWPFTLSKHSHQGYRPLGIVIDSGAHEDTRGGCHIRFSAFGWTLICELPSIIPDYTVRHLAGELHEAAFRRYCEIEHSSKSRRFRIRYVGVIS